MLGLTPMRHQPPPSFCDFVLIRLYIPGGGRTFAGLDSARLDSHFPARGSAKDESSPVQQSIESSRVRQRMKNLKVREILSVIIQMRSPK